MSEVINFEEEKKKLESKDPITLDYILAAPALIASSSISRKLLKDITSFYSIKYPSMKSPIHGIGYTMMSFILSTYIYGKSVTVVKTMRESVVNGINAVKEDMHGDC